MGNITGQFTPIPAPTRLPYYGRTLFAGGNGNIEILPFIGWRDVNIRGFYKGRLVTAEICGESLSDDGIFDGDLAVIELTQEPRDGQLVAVLTQRGMIAKFFYRQPDGKIRLESRNSKYAPLYFRPDQVTIQGVVREIIRKFN